MSRRYYDPSRSGRRRSEPSNRRLSGSSSRGDSFERESNGYTPRKPFKNSNGLNGQVSLNSGTIAVLAGVLVLGVGIGSAITSTTQGGEGNIASQQQLDMAVPDPEFCRQWGASAFVIDVEMYTTLNPSTSFVTQPALQPGCVIRRENWSLLQKQGVITNEDVRECKQ